MPGFARFSSRRRLAAAGLFLLAASCLSAPALAQAQKVYGRTPEESSPPSWPAEPKAPKGAPNILLVMTDDVGFGASSTFGGPIPTPTFDALAREGLRFNRFHTSAICSPTRASLLTGRNPQAVGMGYVANWATGYDGYDSVIPKSAGTLPRILEENGYDTAMFGKGHITPEWETSQAGPFDRWPTGLGFEYFYGFLGADSSAFEPNLVENTRHVDRPPGADYVLDRDLADHAIGWIAQQHAEAPDKPFFVYLAPGTAHAPNHAPREWLDRFKGRFDAGWDALRAETFARQKALGIVPAGTDEPPRPAGLPRWDSLTAEQKRLYARYMEAYAAALAYADAQIGRVIQSLRDSGEIDNTLVIYIQGDNGGSAEGSFDGKLFEQSPLAGVKEDPAYASAHIDEIGTRLAYSLYPGGWGWALNSPFQWAKRYASHFGGVRNGMVIAWPHHIKDPGGLRNQFLHVSDIMPTLLDIAGIEPPAMLDGVPQQPVTGLSFRYALDDKAAPSRRTEQVFGIAENLSLYKDGWVAATTPKVTPWEKAPPPPVAIGDRKWELYHVETDFSEAHDVSASDPARLAALKDQFWAEAAKAQILPIQTSEDHQEGRPDLNSGRTRFDYRGPVTQIPETAAPAIVGRSFTIAARIEVPAGGGQGVIVAQGSRFTGYSLWLDGGRPVFTYNLTPAHLTRLEAAAPLAPGTHEIRLKLLLDKEAPTSAGTATLAIDGRDAGQARIDRSFARVVAHNEGFDVGRDAVSPVDPLYEVATSAFTGKIAGVSFTIGR